jgi:hypothetical protein
MMRMSKKNALGLLLGLIISACLTLPAMAQASSTFTNPICSVVNFRFCDQGSAPSPVPPPPHVSNDVPPPPDERSAQARPSKQKKVARAKKTHKASGEPAGDADPAQN